VIQCFEIEFPYEVDSVCDIKVALAERMVSKLAQSSITMFMLIDLKTAEFVLSKLFFKDLNSGSIMLAVLALINVTTIYDLGRNWILFIHSSTKLYLNSLPLIMHFRLLSSILLFFFASIKKLN
jgi:hypothetical protein